MDLRVVMGSSKRAKYFYYFWQTDSIDQVRGELYKVICTDNMIS